MINYIPFIQKENMEGGFILTGNIKGRKFPTFNYIIMFLFT